MRSITTATLLATLTACSNDSTMRVTDTPAPAYTQLSYPTPERSDTVDDYFGTKVADPFRGLEDPDAPPTRTWIEAENKLTHAWLDAVPERAEIERRLTAVWNYERWNAPTKEAHEYFAWRNDGLQNQPVLWVFDRWDAEPRVLLDPNTLRADGTAAIPEERASKDGKHLAYAISEAGSDWNTIRVRDIATAKDLDDVVAWVKFSSIAWSPDGSGFWYSTFPDHDTSGKVALANQKLMFHKLGTEQSADTTAYARPDKPNWGFVAEVTDDGALLVIHQSEGTEQKNRVFLKDLMRADSEVTPFLDAFDAEYDLIAKKGERLYFRTDNGAPNGRMIAIDVRHHLPADWIELVPERKEAIESAVACGDRLIVTYLKDAANEARIFELDGRAVGTIPLPGLGSIVEMHGRLADPECFFSFTSFTTPTSVWRYDMTSGKASVFKSPKVDFSPADYVTEQTFYPSRDGTRIPLFVTHRRDVKLTRDTPCLLYGYGGFNIAIKPTFAPGILVWMERGGSYAVANLRGGSEYGREWHESGTKARKQNVFDDFIAAAEFLQAKGWTSKAKLAIHGRSNGGLLVGACMTQRPDLYGACLPGVGVLDMLRYHRFTIGWAWASDYGRSDENEESFRWLHAYSPLHNVKAGVAYPPTLITTGDHDDRVVPAHSFKFAATLQSAQSGKNPILIRIETRGGHGAGKPTSMQIEEIADEWAFLTRALGIGKARASAAHAN